MTPSGAINCLLCKAAVSVRAGNLEKLKVHIESDHDVFYNKDILIAINFLEDHEKDIIVEKVLPRMRFLINSANNLHSDNSEHLQLVIEKRLLEQDNDISVNASKKAKYCTDLNKMNVVNNIDEIQEETLEENIENSVETLSINSGPTKDTASVEDEDEFSECEVCHKSIRKSVLSLHRKYHISTSATTVECDICRKMFSKKSMYKHRRRCEIMNRSRKLKEEKIAASSIQQQERSFECKVCPAEFQTMDSLKMHISKEHAHEQELEDTEHEYIEEELNGDKIVNTQMNYDLQERSSQIGMKSADSIKCEFCDNVYTHKNSLRRHKKKHKLSPKHNPSNDWLTNWEI